MTSSSTDIRCTQCGTSLAPESSFCEQCGARLGSPLSPVSEPAEPESLGPEPARIIEPVEAIPDPPPADGQLAWTAAIPMVNNPFFLWDMAKLWGISCSFLFLLMFGLWVVEQTPQALQFAFIIPTAMFAGFFVFSLLIALVFFFNKYYAQIVFSDDGIAYDLVRWTRKLGKAVTAGSIVLGVIAGAPQVVGAGLLAEAQRSLVLPWGDIKKVTFFPRMRVITLSNSWRPVIRLWCPDDDVYAMAKEQIEKQVAANDGSLNRK